MFPPPFTLVPAPPCPISCFHPFFSQVPTPFHPCSHSPPCPISCSHPLFSQGFPPPSLRCSCPPSLYHISPPHPLFSYFPLLFFPFPIPFLSQFLPSSPQLSVVLPGPHPLFFHFTLPFPVSTRLFASSYPLSPVLSLKHQEWSISIYFFTIQF